MASGTLLGKEVRLSSERDKQRGVMALDLERRPTARPHSWTVHLVPGRTQAPASAANNPMNGRCQVKFPP